MPEASDDVFRVDIVDMELAEASSQASDTLESFLFDYNSVLADENETREITAWMDFFEPNRRKDYEALGTGPSRTCPSIEQPPELKLKLLPSYLHYAYLAESFILTVIIASDLTSENKD